MTTVLPIEDEAPLEAYGLRAGNGGPPAGHAWSLPATAEEAAPASVTSNATRTVWVDGSSYQRVVTDAYPEPMFAFRGDTGHGTDHNAAPNWAWCERTPRCQVALSYLVLIPGNEAEILARMRNLLGAHPDPGKLAVMVDMESGREFAGPGDHSASGNKMAELIAGWLGDQRRVVPYANRYDYTSNWPHMVSWLKPREITASYSAAWPGTWGQQYYGGMNFPTPAGLPRSMAPFGSNVDLNVAHASIATIRAQLGLGDWTDMATEAQVEAAVTAAIAKALVTRNEIDGTLHELPAVSTWTHGAVTIIEKEIEALAAAISPAASAAVKKAHDAVIAQIVAAAKR